MIIERIEGFGVHMLLVMITLLVYGALAVSIGTFCFVNAFVALVSPKAADDLFEEMDKVTRKLQDRLVGGD